jgi:hypothetical protein
MAEKLGVRQAGWFQQKKLNSIPLENLTFRKHPLAFSITSLCKLLKT